MNKVQSEILSDQVCQFYINSGKNRKLTYEVFKAQGRNYRVLWKIIKRFEERGSSEYKKPTGRPRTVLTPQNLRKIDADLRKNPKLSTRNQASHREISRRSVRNARKELGYKSFVQRAAPKYVADQENRCKKGARRIYNSMLAGKVIVMDDETYCQIDADQIPGRNFFTTKSRNDEADDIKFKSKEKFAKKYMVWQAIDSEGNVSKPCVLTGTVNSERYLKILREFLIPFILEHHEKKDILFWPDLASSHYAKNVVTFLEGENINFVGKSKNTPNLPQARPIEKFWALCKRKYKERGIAAKNIVGFRRIWQNISRKVAEESGQALMRSLKSKLRKVWSKGVFEPLK